MKFDKNDYVLITFKRMVEERGFTIDAIDEDELIHLSKDDEELKISLDNLRKDYEATGEDDIIEEFVEAITSSNEIPGWEIAKNGIYPSLFPAAFDFGDYIHYPITDDFNMVIVYDFGNKKSWLDEDQLATWQIDNQTLLKTAYQNLDKVLDNAILEIEDVEGKKLAFFSLEDETMKSVLVLSKNLKNKVAGELDWPLAAVIPVRDFSYVFAAADFDFFAERLGGIVMDQYKNSGYPISTEVLEIDGETIKAIAKFEIDEEEDDYEENEEED